MHSPYTPDLGAPNMANPFEAETFRGSGLFKPGVKLSLKTGLGSLKGGIKASLKNTLKIFFKSPRNIKRIMKGSSDEAIEFAIKNSDEAADSLATQVTKHIKATQGEGFYKGKKKFLDDLPETWKPTTGKPTTNIKGVEYSNDIIAPFYQSGGKKRVIKYKVADPNAGKQTPKELEGIGSDGNVLADASTTPGATNDMESALRQLETSVDGNPIKSSMDDLLADGGKLSDEGIEIATKEIAAGKGAYGDDFIKSLNDVSPTSLRNQLVDDIAKRSRFGKKGKGLAYVGAVFLVGAGLWMANNFLEEFASKLWGDDCTREYFENAFPDASAEELDAKVDECIDAAADRLLYLGAAAVGVGGLLALFVLSRIIRKKTR
jgi:hypothetical protein